MQYRALVIYLVQILADLLSNLRGSSESLVPVLLMDRAPQRWREKP